MTPTADHLHDVLAALAHLDDEEVAAAAAAAFDASAGDGDHATLIDVAVACMDLTSLEATDTPDRVRELAARARRPDHHDASCPRPAALCVWSDLVGEAADALTGSGIRAAAVAGAFPHARAPLAVRIAEVEAATAAGAEEIDVVIDRAALADDRPFDAVEQLLELRQECGGAALKVILETGSLGDADAVQAAAWVALLGGADFLKTSTGKDGPGASPAAVWVLVHAARAYEQQTGRRVGVKISGGVRTADDAVGYLRLVRDAGGADWLEPDRLRLGASSLLGALIEARNRS